MRRTSWAAALVLSALVPCAASGQQRVRTSRPAAARPAPADTTGRRRTQDIIVRGRVPAPQIITVRPREVPTYSRQVLVPNFYDHDFWPSILPAYLLVPQRAITGGVALDSAAMMAPGARPAAAPGGAPPARSPR